MILFPALSKSIKRATVRPWCLPLGEVHLGEWVGMKPIRNSQFAIKSRQTPRGGVSTSLVIQGLLRATCGRGFKPLLF